MKAKPFRRQPAGAQSGVVLIEALIGFLIFMVGVLGLVGLQAAMSRAQVGAMMRAEATVLANEVIGVMWGDSPSNFGKYRTATCDSHSPCAEWLAKLKRRLPGSNAQLEYVASEASGYELKVTVTWKVPGEGEHRYEMVGSIASWL